jgi:hypothetical protein
MGWLHPTFLGWVQPISCLVGWVGSVPIFFVWFEGLRGMRLCPLNTAINSITGSHLSDSFSFPFDLPFFLHQPAPAPPAVAAMATEARLRPIPTPTTTAPPRAPWRLQPRATLPPAPPTAVAAMAPEARLRAVPMPAATAPPRATRRPQPRATPPLIRLPLWPPKLASAPAVAAPPRPLPPGGHSRASACPTLVTARIRLCQRLLARDGRGRRLFGLNWVGMVRSISRDHHDPNLRGIFPSWMDPFRTKLQLNVDRSGSNPSQPTSTHHPNTWLVFRNNLLYGAR